MKICKRGTFLLLLLIVASSLPVLKVDAKARSWYGIYSENRSIAKKVVRFKENSVILKGIWKFSADRLPSTGYRERKLRRSFKLTGKTSYYFENLAAGSRGLRRISMKSFKRAVYHSDSYCSFRIKKGKVVKAVISHNVKAGPWRITQHGNENSSQQTFYTLTNQIGDLVIVDGGLRSSSQAVWKEITDHGNRVKAWILTHAHYDHTGAFVEIMGRQDTASLIHVDRIYICPMNVGRMRETARAADAMDRIETYLNLISRLNNTVTLHENDQFNLMGLKIKVFNAWDHNVDQMSKDLCNLGSLMFMVSGRSEKMLFCADVQKEMEKFIISKHRHELKADYVQLAHHGNWGLTTDFYSLVGAEKGAFADAPSYILDDGTGRYDGPQLKRWFMSRGTPYYRFTTVPNSIILH